MTYEEQLMTELAEETEYEDTLELLRNRPENKATEGKDSH